MRKKGFAIAVMTALMCMTAFPAFAGTWIEEGNNWKYYSDTGSLMTGWVEYEENWYYLAASGNMTTGWQKVEGNWYFMYDSGAMAHDTWIDNYYVNSSGKWVKTR